MPTEKQFDPVDACLRVDTQATKQGVLSLLSQGYLSAEQLAKLQKPTIENANAICELLATARQKAEAAMAAKVAERKAAEASAKAAAESKDSN